MESPVKRLTQSLQTDWKKYVLPEAENRDRIVLHRFDNMWVAFEKSAYFLYRSCDNSSPMVGRVDGNPFPLVLCVVPQDKLKVNPSCASYQDSGYRRRIYGTTLHLNDYPQWHDTKVKDYINSHTPLWYFELRDADFIRMLTPAS